jgi:phosphomethylpyrimidine synthase
MKITDEVRQYAEEHGLTSEEALEEGMKEKAGEFNDQGAEIYS